MTNPASAYWNAFKNLRNMRYMRLAIFWALTSAVVLSYFVTMSLLELARTGTLSAETVLTTILLVSGYHVSWSLIVTAARFLTPSDQSV
jgi:hypothetical protein